MDERKFNESVLKLKKSIDLLKEILVSVENNKVDRKSIQELKDAFTVIRKNCEDAL